MKRIGLFFITVALALQALAQPCPAQDKSRKLRSYRVDPEFHFNTVVQDMMREADKLEKYIWTLWQKPRKTRFRVFYYSREGQNGQTCWFFVEPGEANQWQVAIECEPGSALKSKPAALYTKEVFDIVERYAFDDDAKLKSPPLSPEQQVPVSEYVVVLKNSVTGKTKRLGYTRGKLKTPVTP